jgi:hypothetical protein
MKKFLGVGLLAIVAGFCAPAGLAQGPVTTQQINVSPSPAVPQVTQFTATPAVPGTTTVYYWVVSYVGTQPSAPAQFAFNLMPATISATNTVALSWVTPPSVTSVDVLRSSSPDVATLCSANCLLVAGTTAGSFTDTGVLSGHAFYVNGLPFTVNNQLVGGTQQFQILYNGTLLFPCTVSACSVGSITGNPWTLTSTTSSTGSALAGVINTTHTLAALDRLIEVQNNGTPMLDVFMVNATETGIMANTPSAATGHALTFYSNNGSSPGLRMIRLSPNSNGTIDFMDIGTGGPGVGEFASLLAGPGTNMSGCSLSGAAGGELAGKFLSGTSGTCTVTLTLPTAAHGWTCDAHDLTTPADLINQTGTTITSATISGTTVSGDTITFKCMGW